MGRTRKFFGFVLIKMARKAAVLDFSYSILQITYFHQHSPGVTSVLGCDY